MDDFNKHLSTYCDTRLQDLRRQGEIERLFDASPNLVNPLTISILLVVGVVVVTGVLSWWVF